MVYAIASLSTTLVTRLRLLTRNIVHSVDVVHGDLTGVIGYICRSLR
jgi:hypothetical protein